jgi:hypothetical protein
MTHDITALVSALLPLAIAFFAVQVTGRQGVTVGGQDPDSDEIVVTEEMDVLADQIEEMCKFPPQATNNIDEIACCVCNEKVRGIETFLRDFSEDTTGFYIKAPKGAVRSMVLCGIEEAYDGNKGSSEEVAVVHLVCANEKVRKIKGVTFRLLAYALLHLREVHPYKKIMLRTTDILRSKAMYAALGFKCGADLYCTLDTNVFEGVITSLLDADQ